MSETNAITLQAYEQNHQKYIDNHPHDITGELKEWIDGLLEQLPKDASIFEVGSAYGRDADYMEAQGYTVTRTDATHAFVEDLHQRGYEAADFNLITDEFDSQHQLVFADAVLLHFNREEFRQAAEKVFAALTTAGLFGLSLKKGDGEGLTDGKLDASRYFCYWQPEEVKAVLGGVGFASIDIKTSEDYRGSSKPDWLMVTARKGNAA
jgi:hypothetical protein